MATRTTIIGRTVCEEHKNQYELGRGLLPLYQLDYTFPKPDDSKDIKAPPETAEHQINKLAHFIITCIPDEPSQSEGAVDCAIRIMGEREELTASEALFGFMAWLTSFDAVEFLEMLKNNGKAADWVAKFCEVNHLAEPRVNWVKGFTMPEGN